MTDQDRNDDGPLTDGDQTQQLPAESASDPNPADTESATPPPPPPEPTKPNSRTFTVSNRVLLGAAAVLLFVVAGAGGFAIGHATAGGNDHGDGAGGHIRQWQSDRSDEGNDSRDGGPGGGFGFPGGGFNSPGTPDSPGT